MFLEAFVWGLGVSCGACFGLLLFFVLKSGLDWIVDAKHVDRLDKFHGATIDALLRRNELSEEMADHLESISMALEPGE